MRGLGWVYYVTQTILLIYILIFAYSVIKNKIDFKAILNKNLLILYAFPVWATLTALWSINPISTALKGVNFVFVVTGILAGILLLNAQDEKNILKYILPANILVLITSIFSLIFRFPADAWTIGHGLSFAGFFRYQNLLGMATLFTLPGIFSLVTSEPCLTAGRQKSVNSEQRIENSKQQSQRWSLSHSIVENKKKLLFFLLLIFNFLLITMTYSRSVILASIVFGILWLILNRKKRILIFAGLLFIVVLTIAMFNKTFEDELYKIAAKHPYSLLATRTILWEPSFEAAKIGGIFGVGYGMNAPGIYVFKSESIRSKNVNFYREKGNLGLALTEETGVTGLLILTSFVMFVLVKLYQVRNHFIEQIIFITIIALLVQSNFEGWSGGGNEMMQFFLIYNIYSLSIFFYKIY